MDSSTGRNKNEANVEFGYQHDPICEQTLRPLCSLASIKTVILLYLFSDLLKLTIY
jgi:hypothetical protein